MIDEATGKIAVSSSEEVHIYKPYGKKEGALKVRLAKRNPRPSCEVLTIYTVVISVLFTGSQPSQRYIDTIMGVGGRAFGWVHFVEALPNCER